MYLLIEFNVVRACVKRFVARESGQSAWKIVTNVVMVCTWKTRLCGLVVLLQLSSCVIMCCNLQLWSALWLAAKHCTASSKLRGKCMTIVLLVMHRIVIVDVSVS